MSFSYKILFRQKVIKCLLACCLFVEYSTLYSADIYLGQFSSTDQRHCFPQIINHKSDSLVPGVYCAGCPSAILFIVSKVVIDSVELCLWKWSRPHVFYEVFKLFPPFAHRNSSTIIVFGPERCGTTPPLYVCPHPILWRLAPAVSSRNISKDFFMEASARDGCSCSEAWNKDRFFISTITFTPGFWVLSNLHRENVHNGQQAIFFSYAKMCIWARHNKVLTSVAEKSTPEKEVLV